MKHYTIYFPDSPFSSVNLVEGESLALHLTALNSPLLFGCRAGLCGTCLIDVEPGADGHIPSPSTDESEALLVYAPNRPKARLACQLCATGSMSIRRIG